MSMLSKNLIIPLVYDFTIFYLSICSILLGRAIPIGRPEQGSDGLELAALFQVSQNPSPLKIDPCNGTDGHSNLVRGFTY